MSCRVTIAVRDVPEVGNVVRVRDRLWVVSDVTRSELPTEHLAQPQNLLDLTSIEDDGFGETLRVIWEIEPGREVLRAATLPRPVAGPSRSARAARRLHRRRPLGRHRVR